MAFPAYIKYLTFDDKVQDGVSRSKTESGSLKQRKRYSKTFIHSEIKLLMTLAQLDAFIVWFKANKAQSFTFTDPRTDTAYTYQFVDVPSYDLFSKGHKSKWKLSFEAQREI